jgi:hypothetical protein
MASFFTFFIFADWRLLAGKTALNGKCGGGLPPSLRERPDFVAEKGLNGRRLGWFRDPSLRSEFVTLLISPKTSTDGEMLTARK